MRDDPSKTNPSAPPVDWDALARYVAGESSAQESERIAQWLDEHKADAELVAALDNAMTGLALRGDAGIDVEAALANVAAKRDAPEVGQAERLQPPRRDTRFIRRTASPWRAVAFLAAAAAIVVAARLVLYRPEGDGRAPVAAIDGGSARTYVSAVGKRDSVRLADGSRVILGPASQLVVPAAFGQRGREVELYGEAYFDVVHDTTRSFVVRAGDATIRDVGTSFAVRSDSGPRLQVVVTAGAVALRGRIDSAAILHAGDVGTLQSTGGISVRHDASTAPYLAWMRDSLVFREASLAEVSSELRRWYGVELRVEDSTLASRHLTMTFAGDPLERVLRVIGLGLGAEIERHGDTAVVRASDRSRRTQ
jgi:transmembrane sensor